MDVPNRQARGVGPVLNALSAGFFASGGFVPGNWVCLDVVGCESGRTVKVLLVVADHEGERYLVSTLGEGSNWVRDVRADGMRAVLRHGRATPVRLEEVPVDERAPVLRRYPELAPGARPHVSVERTAPLPEFERIAAEHPVFRILVLT